MKSALGVAVVGAGTIAVAHAAAIAATPDMALRVVVGGSMQGFQSLREAAGPDASPERVSDLAEALGRQDVDLVAVCGPSGTHGVHALEALNAGRHVIVEKPLDARLDVARRVAEVAEDRQRRGQVAAVVSQRRFEPDVAAVAADIDARRLGELVSASASVDWWRDDNYFASSWRGTWSQDGGGALINQAIHAVDVMLWWLGEPEEVFAYSARRAHPRIEVEDTLVAAVRMRSGVLCTIHATTGAFPGSPARLRINGTRGSTDIVDWKRGDPAALSEAGSRGELLAYGTRHREQYRDLLEAITTGRDPLVTCRDGLRSLAVVTAAYISARVGRPINVRDVLDGTYDAALDDLGGHL